MYLFIHDMTYLHTRDIKKYGKSPSTRRTVLDINKGGYTTTCKQERFFLDLDPELDHLLPRANLSTGTDGADLESRY